MIPHTCPGNSGIGVHPHVWSHRKTSNRQNLGSKFQMPPQGEGRGWIIYLLVPGKAHLYATACMSLMMLKILYCIQEKKKVVNFAISKQTSGMWGDFVTEAFFQPPAGLLFFLHFLEDKSEQKGRWNGQTLAEADFRCFAGAQTLFF